MVNLQDCKKISVHCCTYPFLCILFWQLQQGDLDLDLEYIRNYCTSIIKRQSWKMVQWMTDSISKRKKKARRRHLTLTSGLYMDTHVHTHLYRHALITHAHSALTCLCLHAPTQINERFSVFKYGGPRFILSLWKLSGHGNH